PWVQPDPPRRRRDPRPLARRRSGRRPHPDPARLRPDHQPRGRELVMTPAPDLVFEDALDQLETIVGDLERGEPELSSALAKYERGVRLLARCHQLLETAERS